MFEEFVAGRGQALQRFGYAPTGDWAMAEDLLQTALARAYPRWSRIRRDDPEAYVRKIMVNTWSSWWRRRWRGEVPSGQLPESAGPDSYASVVVLRYHQDLSEAQVAELLGVTVGTVKSQTAKALAALRGQAALGPYRNQPMQNGTMAAAGGE